MPEKKLRDLFTKTFNEDIVKINRLPESGSSRQYYRIESIERSVIGTYNDDTKENIAFVTMSNHFKNKGISVPEIYSSELENHIYLQEDIGDETLFQNIQKQKKHENDFPKSLIELYKKALVKLINIQINGTKDFDYSVCYPRAAFDKQSIMWDLQYFKYFFVKLAGITFDEQLLENDFNTFAGYILQADTKYFLFRDFQSRNIMLKNDEVYFIDYQGGREGALHYDLVSLLYDAKANIPENVREELKDYYIAELQKQINISKPEFEKHYYHYALIRVMQAMGAYGYRGLFEKKQHFIDSIPYALLNLQNILNKTDKTVETPELMRVFALLIKSEKLQNINKKLPLTVYVKSFSYMRGIPYDISGNGGGFVFDCRFLDNPGRIEKYKKLCGKDKEVIDFLEERGEVTAFKKSVFKTIDMAVKKYQKREFTNLSINFGCTGGQHRSVYMAEQTAKYLSEKYDIIVQLKHTEGF